ncbi:hypothetical protein P170DRAFT_453201 [Aspergillus steynii IBT 23096]|uniref:Uncharacterized protein n=1 Tax=Aspergillus steynii IBT 23096 TaxID=1392250 RepID=A0A2I2GF28_9EURO|nr:uncharacterized protein P170DRAFT_453201 [Aspergillus steynii IBT 23096]PLB51490.1 hypothetical protein P170DRAFT_453201 [Aspergillus steynii IBT 23096]
MATAQGMPDWKPFSVRPFYIILLAILSAALATAQELLLQKSRINEKKGNGLIHYNTEAEIPIGLFICWKYVPTIVTVAYGVMWQVADYGVQRMEPYYQLSGPTGNTGERTINLDYITMFAYFVPYQAFRNRHWGVLISSMGTIFAATAAPALQSTSIRTVENPKCHQDYPTYCDGEYRYFLRLEYGWSRAATVTMGVGAILAVVLLFHLQRKSGLYTDPRGLAGIAAMAAQSPILADFETMDNNIHDDIHEKLKDRRYILRNFRLGLQGEGEIKEKIAPDSSKPREPESPLPIILRPIWMISFIVFLGGCLPWIPVVCFTSLNVITTTLPWLPVLISSIIRQVWATLDFNLKLMEPYYRLSKGNERPDRTLTLDYQGTPYGILPCKALWNGHYLVAMVGFGTILGDVLTVTLTSLSTATETYRTFSISAILSIIIVFIHICSALAVYFRRSRRPFMPRQPATIASILAFIHESRLLDDFAGTEMYTSKQIREMLVMKNKRYSLGWFQCRDGKIRCAVDQEPRVSKYIHGEGYTPDP